MTVTRDNFIFYAASFCSLPLLVQAIIDLMGIAPIFGIEVMIVFSTLLQLSISSFYYELWRGLRSGNMSVEGLIAISTSAFWALSLIAWTEEGIAAGAAYAGISAIAIPAALFGRYISGRIVSPIPKGRSQEFIMPLDARPKTLSGIADRIPLQLVRAGDRIQVFPEEIVPVDGKIVEGIAEFLGGELTGEPVPRHRGPGDWVKAGEICYGGNVTIQSAKGGWESALANAVAYGRMRSHFEEDHQSVDRFLKPIFWIVISFAILVGLSWGAAVSVLDGIKVGLAILAVGLPAGFGFFGSLPLFIGAQFLRNQGILIHRKDITEAARKINELLITPVDFLIIRSPKLCAVNALESEDELIAFAEAMTRRLKHPMHGPLERAMHQRGISVMRHLRKVFYEAGRGFTAEDDDRQILVGNPSLLSRYGVGYREFNTAARDFEKQGFTVWWVAETGAHKRCLGIIAFQHEVRHSAQEAVSLLKANKIKVKLLAPIVGPKYLYALYPLDFDDIMEVPSAEALYEYIINVQHRGDNVAVAGLSPLDFPAIQAANMSIVSQSGPPMFLTYGSMTLSRPDPALLANGVLVCRKIGRVAAQNLVINSIIAMSAAGVALAGFMSPFFAVAFAVISLGAVIMNAMSVKLANKL